MTLQLGHKHEVDRQQKRTSIQRRKYKVDLRNGQAKSISLKII